MLQLDSHVCDSHQHSEDVGHHHHHHHDHHDHDEHDHSHDEELLKWPTAAGMIYCDVNLLYLLDL